MHIVFISISLNIAGKSKMLKSKMAEWQSLHGV